MHLLVLLLILSPKIVDSILPLVPVGNYMACSIDGSWKDKFNNKCSDYQSKLWCKNGLELAAWKATGRGKYGESIEDSADIQRVDAYAACCYCQFNGPTITTDNVQTYFVSRSGADENVRQMSNPFPPFSHGDSALTKDLKSLY
jgi:hypothetical protein